MSALAADIQTLLDNCLGPGSSALDLSASPSTAPRVPARRASDLGSLMGHLVATVARHKVMLRGDVAMTITNLSLAQVSLAT